MIKLIALVAIYLEDSLHPWIKSCFSAGWFSNHYAAVNTLVRKRLLISLAVAVPLMYLLAVLSIACNNSHSDILFVFQFPMEIFALILFTWWLVHLCYAIILAVNKNNANWRYRVFTSLVIVRIIRKSDLEKISAASTHKAW